MRRVVVTGLGLVCPVGTGVEIAWPALVGGRSGVGHIARFDASRYPVRIAGEVRDFDPGRFMDAREVRRSDRFIQFAVAAAHMAVVDAGLDVSREDPTRVGVIVGTGLGGLETIENTHARLQAGGVKSVSPFFVTGVIPNLAAGQIALRHGFQGPNSAPVGACASGSQAVGEGLMLIERGMADVVVAGGAESTISPLGIAGFRASRALSRRNDEPARASRPFDVDRDGFVAAEGAGVLVLESMEHARRRGARAYAELVGYGASADAHHLTEPPEDGAGAQRALRSALRDARLAPENVGFVHAHATSTRKGDRAECAAIVAVFGAHAKRVAVSSTKSMTGHMLGAAGSAGAVVTVLALAHGVLPPTTNVETLDPDCELDVVSNEARETRVAAALVNAFGFGGTNVVLAFRRV